MLPSLAVFRWTSRRDKLISSIGGNEIQPLGIGFPYYAVLPADLYRPDMVAFVEVTPETICRQRGTGKTTEIEILPDLMELAQQTCGELPMVIHGVELSIGSAHG